jgi:hypothetical protein
MKRLAFFAGLIATTAMAADVKDAPGAKLRLLDKLTGTVTDITLADDSSQKFGRLTVQLDGCRYNPDNPSAEAFAHLTILDENKTDPVFNGWMTASSPALSALDHPRYDVWVLRCDVPDLVLPEVGDPPPEDQPPADGTDPATTDGGNG